MIMLFVSFFSWWYGSGWRFVLNSFQRRTQDVARTFSVNQLLSTLFAPWKRIVNSSSTNLAERFHAWGDNLVSRVIGFIIRSFVLLTAGLTLILVMLFTTIELIIWPVLPLAIPGAIVVGIIL